MRFWSIFTTFPWSRNDHVLGNIRMGILNNTFATIAFYWIYSEILHIFCENTILSKNIKIIIWILRGRALFQDIIRWCLLDHRGSREKAIVTRENFEPIRFETHNMHKSVENHAIVCVLYFTREKAIVTRENFEPIPFDTGNEVFLWIIEVIWCPLQIDAVLAKTLRTFMRT